MEPEPHFETFNRRSIRLRDYDYSQAGAYFVTICTHRRACLFGDVVDDDVELNALGRIVMTTWESLPGRYPQITLDAFVIMPNHVHGIIMIEDGERPVGAIHELPLRNTRYRRRTMTLPLVVGYFKMNASKQINRTRLTPGAPVWQRNYYEHIIRGDDDLGRIRAYIALNPRHWALDRENPASHKERLPNGSLLDGTAEQGVTSGGRPSRSVPSRTAR